MPKYVEGKRGCGYRTVGKLYLVGSGIAYPCPSLPLFLAECDLCGYMPTQYRDFTWMSKQYLYSIKEPTGRACHPTCPICYPGTNTQDKYGLMWVGKKFYTIESFMKEARDVGVSKAIKQIPKDLVMGETWILVAHPLTPDPNDEDFKEKLYEWAEAQKNQEAPKPPGKPGIFYAFIPKAVEILVYEKEATPEHIANLKAKGITPVIIDNDADGHARRTRKTKTRVNIA